jgi:formamidopyrimidine-DNA glycosylase
MPEMPEVETLKRKLRKKLSGRQILSVQLSGFPLRSPIDDGFAGKLEGRTIRGLLRRGKYLVVELEPKAFWLIHLGMSGRVLFHQANRVGARHTHVVVQFTDFSELEYRDPRRFGLMSVHEVERPEQIPQIASLGKEPLASNFSGSWLEAQLRKSRQEIKSFLLDQRKIAGLGNIYVCESLFRAGIHPGRRCFALAHDEVFRLADAIRSVMRNAIRRRGTSFSDFVDSDGLPGENQNHLAVFQKEGERCSKCGSTICRMSQGNRSTFYCADCQH